MKARLVLTGLLFSLCAGAIAYGVLTDARVTRLQALLRQIDQAEEKVSYVGIREMVGEGTVVLRIWSREGQKRVEFLGARMGARKPPAGARPPRGPMSGALPFFLRPGDEQWRRILKDCDLAVRNHDVILAGRETVAGREADLIELHPHVRGRARYRLWADAQRRLLLRFEVRQGDQTLFEAGFKEIAFAPSFPERIFEEPRRRPGWLNVERQELGPEAVAERAGFPVWLPESVPAGFERRGSALYRVRAEIPPPAREAAKRFFPPGLGWLDGTAAHFDYTDGIAVLSVVQCAADSAFWKFVRGSLPASPPSPRAGEPVTVLRLTDRRGSAFLLELEGTVLLVAGNVPSAEIEQMIRSFKRR
jgi:negative regulator of sigma E activity